jgi:hypothetical protein
MPIREVHQPPLLAELFARPSAADSSWLTLNALAKSLGATPERLYPLALGGWLHLREQSRRLDCYSQVLLPTERALQWMRSWFLPAQDKPLFSLEDAAILLATPAKSLLLMAELHDVPMTLDLVLGATFSQTAIQKLLRMKLANDSGPLRFDRQAILSHFLGRSEPLSFDELLEAEIERIARLSEPERTLRSEHLARAYRESSTVAECHKRYHERMARFVLASA